MLRRQPIAFVLLLLLGAIPCLARASFVYVTNYGDGTISQFRANSNGTLTPLTPPTVKAFPRCHSIVADPKGRFLYALSALEASRRNCRISQFRIRSNGTLVPLLPPTVLVPYNSWRGGGPFLISSDPSGRFFYVPGRDGSMTQFHCSKNGLLQHPSQVSASYLAYGEHYSVSYDQRHSLLFVLSYGRIMDIVGGTIAVFRREGSSLYTLRPAYVGSDNYTPGAFALARHGQVAYIFHGVYSKAKKTGIEIIDQRLTQPDGKLISLKPSQVLLPADAVAEEMLVDPGSRYCYLINNNAFLNGHWSPLKNVRLSRYAILRNGTLGRLTRQMLPVSDEVKEAVFTPTGRFLYLLTDNGVRPFRVKSDGSVVSLLPRSIRAGREPLGMVYVQR